MTTQRHPLVEQGALTRRVGARPDAPVGTGRPLRLPNLLNDAETLAGHLVNQVEATQWLDSYLLACGIDQILEDALHPDLLMLGRVARQLRARIEGKAGSAAMVTAASARAAVWALHGRWLRHTAVARLRHDVSNLAVELARLVLGFDVRGGGANPEDLLRRATRLQQELTVLPARVRHDPLRLPSGFRNLDQSPHDVQGLVDRALERWPDARRPVLVVGIRTTGSYLAPLAVAALRAAGRHQVRWLTLRPGQRWSPPERRTLRWAADHDALTLLLDDPPNSWGTMAKSARELRHAGLEPASVALLVQGFPGAAGPPDSLNSHPVVTLPWEHWHIHGQLETAAVQATLRRLLDGEARVGTVSRHHSQPKQGARRHVGVLFDVQMTPHGGSPENRLIYAEGVGLGYFGTHSLALSRPLQAFLPRIYGVADGLMYRDWLPESQRLREEDGEAAVEQIVAYVSAHARAHVVPEDTSLRAGGRETLWRWAGRFLASPLGRVEVCFWPVVEAAAKVLLRAENPSVVDGDTAVTSWFRDGHSRGRLRKVGFAQRAFSGFEMFCYDPVFDLANAAASCESEAIGLRLRDLYTARSGVPVEPERWLLYQLAHLNGYQKEVMDAEVERRMARRFQRYFGEVLLQGISVPPSGELCAIDIDGVLELAPLGVPAASVEAFRALRGLFGHGYRPVIATGRSIGEVRDRCVHYRLAGGVAEYGAAIYTADGDHARDLLTDTERETLRNLRLALEQTPGVLVDRSYATSVRAYRLNADGRRRALRGDQIAGALEQVSGEGVRAIQGEGQTDFMVEGVTKATGLRALAAELGMQVTSSDWLAMAVGDTASDLPMLRLARLAFAPANAQRELRTDGVTVSRYAHQAGLEDAVTHLVGHRPGRCAACQEAPLSPRTRLLLSLLTSPRRASRASKAMWAAGLMAKVVLQVLMAGGGSASDGGRALPRRAPQRIRT